MGMRWRRGSHHERITAAAQMKRTREPQIEVARTHRREDFDNTSDLDKLV